MLIGAIAAASVSFVVMGLAQMRRTRALARRAHGAGLKFSGDDPFDMPRRYANFSLIALGHSPQAHNVSYGRLAGWLVRTFDFHYEIGHGPRRITRHYSVVVAETDLDLPAVTIWNNRDAEYAPLAIRQSGNHVACWTFIGDERLARTIAHVGWPLAESGFSAETCGSVVMFCICARRSTKRTSRLLDVATAVLRTLSEMPGSDPPETTERPQPALPEGR